MNPFQLSRNTTLLSDAVTEKAVELACEKLKKKLCAIAAGMLSCSPEEMIFENGRACRVNTDQSVSLAETRLQMISQQ